MALQHPNTKKRVWHDIQPAPSRPKPVPVPPKKSSPLKTILAAIARSSAYIQLQKQLTRIPRKVRIIGSVVVAVSIAFVIYFFATNQPPKATTDPASQAAAQAASNGPDYPTILPEGKTIQDLGGWIRASPLDKNPVFAYADTISTTNIKVNEQPLPASFKQDTGQKIEELIRGYGTTEKIIAGNTDVHVATAEDGSQSIIFYRDSLLVLITAPTQLQNSQWIDYITSLR